MENLCRLCGNDGEVLLSVLGDSPQVMRIRLQIFNVLQFEIQQNDVLPTSVCSLCLTSLRNASTFINSCQNVQKILQEKYGAMSSNDQVKTTTIFDASDRECLGNCEFAKLKNLENTNSTKHLDQSNNDLIYNQKISIPVREEQSLVHFNIIPVASEISSAPLECNLKVPISSLNQLWSDSNLGKDALYNKQNSKSTGGSQKSIISSISTTNDALEDEILREPSISECESDMCSPTHSFDGSDEPDIDHDVTEIDVCLVSKPLETAAEFKSTESTLEIEKPYESPNRPEKIIIRNLHSVSLPRIDHLPIMKKNIDELKTTLQNNTLFDDGRLKPLESAKLGRQFRNLDAAEKYFLSDLSTRKSNLASFSALEEKVDEKNWETCVQERSSDTPENSSDQPRKVKIVSDGLRNDDENTLILNGSSCNESEKCRIDELDVPSTSASSLLNLSQESHNIATDSVDPTINDNVLSGTIPEKSIKLRCSQQKKVDHNSKDNPRYSCESCDMKFVHRSAFERHIDAHPFYRPFVCQICNASYRRQKLLNAHKSIVHAQVTLQCSLCSYLARSKGCLTLHMRTTHEKPFVCAICDYKFGSKRAVELHIANVHSGAPKVKNVCEICGASFRYKAGLVRHQRNIHFPEPKVCPTCGHVCPNTTSYNTHRQRCGSDRERFTCAICNQTYADKSWLREHMNKHLNIKPYKCDVCGKRFFLYVRLSTHKAVHQAPSHQCSVCFKSFNRKDNMKNHMKKHFQ